MSIYVVFVIFFYFSSTVFCISAVLSTENRICNTMYYRLLQKN